MCTPAAAAAVGIGSQVGGTALSLWGNEISGKANAANLELKAKLSEFEADEIARAGRIATDRARVAGRQAEAQQRTGFAGAGVDVNVGSAAEVQEQTGVMGEVDASELARQYRYQTWAKQAEAAQYRQGVELQRKYGWVTGAQTVLSGASSVASTYAQWKNPTSGAETVNTQQVEDGDSMIAYNRQRKTPWNWG